MKEFHQLHSVDYDFSIRVTKMWNLSKLTISTLPCTIHDMVSDQLNEVQFFSQYLKYIITFYNYWFNCFCQWMNLWSSPSLALSLVFSHASSSRSWGFLVTEGASPSVTHGLSTSQSLGSVLVFHFCIFHSTFFSPKYTKGMRPTPILTFKWQVNQSHTSSSTI
jgi:hypothetical protein